MAALFRPPSARPSGIILHTTGCLHARAERWRSPLTTHRDSFLTQARLSGLIRACRCRFPSRRRTRGTVVRWSLRLHSVTGGCSVETASVVTESPQRHTVMLEGSRRPEVGSYFNTSYLLFIPFRLRSSSPLRSAFKILFAQA